MMKKVAFYCIALLAMTFLSCGNIELPDTQESEDGKQDTVSTPPDVPIISVEDALTYPQGTTVLIEGYMVGFILGSSISSGAEFNLPYGSENTNFLLADVPNEDNPEKCMPVKLEKDGSSATRSELNFYDHPELFQKRIRIYGEINTYFRKNGIVHIFSYKIINDETEGGEENPGDTDGKIQDPDINHNEEFIPEGRLG